MKATDAATEITDTQRSPLRMAWTALALILASIFMLKASSDVDRLTHNFDEGVYIFQARGVAAGEVPGRDFFTHQPPAYPILMSLTAGLHADSLGGYRLLSALAWAWNSFVIFVIARRHAGVPAGLIAQTLMLATPLGLYFGRLALPNATMVACETTALWLLTSTDLPQGRRVLAAALAFVLACLMKPLSVPAALAAWLWLVLRRQWRAAATLGLGGILFTTLAWLSLDLLMRGAFSELIRLQLDRFSGNEGFEQFRLYEAFQRHLQTRGVDTALEWNIAEHVQGLLTLGTRSGANSNGHLTLLSMLGLGLVAWKGDHVVRRLAGACVCWLGLAIVFNLFVWEPIWNHYFVQYLAPMTLLAGLGTTALRGLPAPWATWTQWGLAVLVMGVAAQVALASQGSTFRRNAAFEQMQPASTWLTLDPTVNVITGTIPACDLYDPFNVYGNRSLVALLPVAQQRFLIAQHDLFACLDADESSSVLVSDWTTWFLAPEAIAEMRRRYPGRVHFANPGRAGTRRQ